MTLVAIIALHAGLLLHSNTPMHGEDAPDIPMTMELRRIPPPAPIEPVVKEDVRKLVAVAAEPERHTVAPPPQPVRREPLKPKPRRTPPPRKPEPSRPVQEEPQAKVDPRIAEATGSAQQAVGGVLSGSSQARPGSGSEILSALVRVIEANKRYPRSARRAGIEGSVSLRVTISPDGRVAGCTLARACGKTILDDAARELGNTLVGLAIPAAKGRSVTVTIPVQYALTR